MISRFCLKYIRIAPSVGIKAYCLLQQGVGDTFIVGQYFGFATKIDKKLNFKCGLCRKK
jgi:hypothetical protein